jgi:transposase-like protein
MNPPRSHFTPDQKAQIVRRHLSGREPISDLADELSISARGRQLRCRTCLRKGCGRKYGSSD